LKNLGNHSARISNPSCVQAARLIAAGVDRYMPRARTQNGNNNAYCQDNEISWVNWSLSRDDLELLSFVVKLIEFRKAHPSFRRRNFFRGRLIKGTGVKDIVWLTPDGREMTDEEWSKSYARCLGLYLEGGATGEDDEKGEPVKDDDFVLLINSSYEPIPFVQR
jgi:glycogen operon protein